VDVAFEFAEKLWPPVVDGFWSVVGFLRTDFPKNMSMVPLFLKFSGICGGLATTGREDRVKAFIFAIEKGFGLKTAASGRVDISSSDLSRDSSQIFDLDP
jgi:hypothetical protein